MSHTPHSQTLLDIPLIEERYGRSFLASVGLHLGAALFLLFSPSLFPTSAIQIGGGAGGGIGGETYTVGVVDELSGGAGMIKPSLIPQPPALPAEKQVKEELKEKAIPLPATIEPKKIKQQQAKAEAAAEKPTPAAKSNVIPTSPQPGAGGTGGRTGGSGGGSGGGNGVSIGSGSGGLGDDWYARTVEKRISESWVRPPEGIRVEIVYSFYIAPAGNIYNVTKEKSSGNDDLDRAAERAIRACDPLTSPPPMYGGRPMKFVAQFVYPPSP